MVDSITVEHVDGTLSILPTHHRTLTAPLRNEVHEGEATTLLCLEVGNDTRSRHMATLLEQVA